MLSLKKILFLLTVLISISISAQKDSTQVDDIKIKEKIKTNSNYFNPLSPSKAAFYAAILPGGGQIYNKKYWKAPIVWGAMGTSIYLYLDNNNEYDRYRTAFKMREAGLQDEFTNNDGSLTISRNGLISAQKTLKNNRDLALLSTVIFYVLQIVEASVNAHLLQFNTNDNVSFTPTMSYDTRNYEIPKFGLSFKFNF
ncbi:MAG: DUF5683 domain-containing protein [Polaribacter sp.]|nr:DUF5683 domain-containing protein [Polaribacter sp.]MDG1811155.1 DUF5683 domain-containing protein [Polaribacter sp.]MDG1993422.1 DUF5683 domain-containing protein [Polaribacter sp.]